MARGNTKLPVATPAPTSASTAAESDAGFAGEFRDLARQRRFVKANSADFTAAQEQAPAATAPAAEHAALVAELTRAYDRIVQSHEELARVSERLTRAEADVANSQTRVLAAQILVRDAQDAAHAAAERSAWLEGRCETLQEALDLAVNASLLSRWRWRRQMRTSAES